jgi:pimeloyl-ACP methyl ester carboxylesterase
MLTARTPPSISGFRRARVFRPTREAKGILMTKRIAPFLVVLLISVSIAAVGVRPAVAQDTATPAAFTLPPLPAAWGEVAGQTAHINGVDIYYEIYGHGDPVILLHGGLSNGTYFGNQIPELAKHYQLIVMDSRGHGRSTFDDQPITYELMAADVIGLMDHLGIAKASIVGWSDGGIIGLDLAIHHPERLNMVIAYGANYNLSGELPGLADSPLFAAVLLQAAADYQRLSPQPERWDAFLSTMFTLYATEPNYSDAQLQSITVPVLILDGAKEEGIDLNQTKLMALLIPGATLVLMPDTGHFAPLEQPAEFNRIVEEYLGT